jgi:hypothetical protein
MLQISRIRKTLSAISAKGLIMQDVKYVIRAMEY